MLVMVSTTVALYVGMEDILKTRFPHDVTISGTELSEEEKASIDQTITDIVENMGLLTGMMSSMRRHHLRSTEYKISLSCLKMI